MARKLNTEEEQLFADLLRNEQTTTNEDPSAQFLRRFSKRRDTALQLTPELAALFGDDPLGPVIS